MLASWGVWVAQSVKHQNLDFSSGHDLTIHGFEPHICQCGAFLGFSLSLSLCPSPARSLSLKINK